MPEVSIGMPVYNGAQLLERALASLLRQSFQDFELIISDNASTDATSDICRRFAEADPRIRYIRQASNIGGMGNFVYVLSQASAPYFMWAAHDDCWEPDFIAANHEVLSTHADAVLSVSQVEFVSEQGEIVDVGPTGTYPLLGSPRQNLLQYLTEPAQNSRFYGLHRIEVIRACMRQSPLMWALDWLVMARTLKFGKHYEVHRCLFRRSPDGDSADAATMIARFHRSAIVRAMPLLPYSWAVLTDPLIPKTIGLWRPLYKWNKYYADLWLQQWSQPWPSLLRRIKRLVVKPSCPHTDPTTHPATVHAIQRLLAQSLTDEKPDHEGFSQPGDVADTNALLDTPGDECFVEAAYRQLLGLEVGDRARLRWLRRLRWCSRAGMLVCLRRSRTAKAHAIRMPGLWGALLLDQPRHGWLRLPFVRGVLDNARRKLVGRCYSNRRRSRQSDFPPQLPQTLPIRSGPLVLTRPMP